MRKQLACLVSLLILLVGVVSVGSIRDSQAPSSEESSKPKVHSQGQTAASEAQAPLQINVDLNSASSNSSPPQKAATGLEAKTAAELWTLLRNSDTSNKELIAIFQHLIGSCRQAKKLNAQVSLLDGAQKENALAAGLFLDYCNGFDQIEAQIEADIERRRLLIKSEPDDMVVLSIAAPKNKQATSVLLDEIKTSNNPYIAREIAIVVSDLTRPGLPLESWSKLLPPSASGSERSQVFGLAAEMIYCANYAACQPMSFLSNHACLYEQRCVRGEDLLTYRRRTTAPIVYQSAQLVADQIRRSHIEQ
jgi:hypothetical protein